MYDADDLTEETEEIILTRQKDDVASAEFALRMEQLDHKRTLEVTLPREAIALANSERDTAIALRQGRGGSTPRHRPQENRTRIPRNRPSTAKRKPSPSSSTTAPCSNSRPRPTAYFYHGPIENGRWITGDGVKALVKHGRPLANGPSPPSFPPPPNSASSPSSMKLPPAVETRTRRHGRARRPRGRRDPGRITPLATAPGPDGTYRAELTATWPKDPAPVTGASAQIRVIAYHQPTAILLPAKALTLGAQAGPSK